MGQLAEIGGDHVRRRRQPGRAAKFRHDFPARIAALGTTRIFGIGQHGVRVPAYTHRFGQRPGAVRVQRDARIGEAFVQRGDGLHLGVRRQHATFQLEVLEAIALACRLCLAHDGTGIECGLVTHPEPCIVGPGFGAVVERGAPAVANKEQVAEHGDGIALHAIAQ